MRIRIHRPDGSSFQLSKEDSEAVMMLAKRNHQSPRQYLTELVEKELEGVTLERGEAAKGEP